MTDHVKSDTLKRIRRILELANQARGARESLDDRRCKMEDQVKALGDDKNYEIGEIKDDLEEISDICVGFDDAISRIEENIEDYRNIVKGLEESDE